MKTAVNFLVAFALFLVLTSLASCKKDKNTDPNKKKSSGTVALQVGVISVSYSWGTSNTGFYWSGTGNYYAIGQETPNEDAED